MPDSPITASPPHHTVKLSIRHLSKIFGPRPERALERLRQGASKQEIQERYGNAVGVHDVSFDIKAGETFVPMGLSGSGKSTLLRLLNRLHEPTAGEITVDEIELTSLGKRELLQVRREKFSGMAFQQFAILPHRTVLNKEFAENGPEDVIAFLDNFYWTGEQMGEVMLMIREGMEPIEAARAWISAKPEVVQSWLE